MRSDDTIHRHGGARQVDTRIHRLPHRSKGLEEGLTVPILKARMAIVSAVLMRGFAQNLALNCMGERGGGALLGRVPQLWGFQGFGRSCHTSHTTTERQRLIGVQLFAQRKREEHLTASWRPIRHCFLRALTQHCAPDQPVSPASPYLCTTGGAAFLLRLVDMVLETLEAEVVLAGSL